VDESNIAPGSAAAIEALGGAGPATQASPSGSPGATVSPSPETATPEPSGSGAVVATPRPPARDELWIPIVLVVLAFLTLEWGVYQRDALVRLWRGASMRFGRAPGGAR
jgi:hypothetical protein